MTIINYTMFIPCLGQGHVLDCRRLPGLLTVLVLTIRTTATNTDSITLDM